jgi:hypothetical protein
MRFKNVIIYLYLYAGLYSSKLHLSTLKVEAAGICEMLYRATRCHVLEDDDDDNLVVICSALSGPTMRALRDNFPVSAQRAFSFCLFSRE